MEQRVSIVTLGVADLARSAEFYEGLGWKRSSASSEAIVFFQAGGMALALYPRDELAKDANAASDGSGFRGVTIAYNTRSHDEVNAILAEAERVGARIVKLAAEASPIPMASCGRWHGIRFLRLGRTGLCGCRSSSCSPRRTRRITR
jgi:predicted lactoylglutathione lyase